VAAGLSPALEDQIAEAVDDRGVLTEVGCALHVPDGSKPLRDAIEVA
jgi:hypothetical protein